MRASCSNRGTRRRLCPWAACSARRDFCRPGNSRDPPVEPQPADAAVRVNIKSHMRDRSEISESVKRMPRVALQLCNRQKLTPVDGVKIAIGCAPLKRAALGVIALKE